MKSLATILISLLFVASTTYAFALNSKSYKKHAFGLKCFDYVNSRFDNLDYASIDQITLSAINNPGNWAITSSNPQVECNPSHFLCAICFDDTQLSMSQALTITWTFYVTYGYLPHGSDVDPSDKTVLTWLRDIDNQ
ncbi:hypothetical protein [Pseudobacter ginsenosidimutans]|uniref:Uncharacterized protein n=1 Tax=Pseudobacter ginsenosidimutans TaxID=661488 RepID=A0A4Q7MLC4_9BACT|nr:hypothetical protein [Pseudobacter ginsenosidimutans]QEC40303.1 hypothetical protein FSB84_00830 [Pseudobacter ginsenosidimutans]RZS69094.1 hypothetical protein EV199_4919 [Pseudobacter ginsenosidimutans]